MNKQNNNQHLPGILLILVCAPVIIIAFLGTGGSNNHSLTGKIGNIMYNPMANKCIYEVAFELPNYQIKTFPFELECFSYKTGDKLNQTDLDSFTQIIHECILNKY